MSQGFDSKLEFFSSVTNLIYSFGYQYCAIPVYKNLNKNDYRRIRKVAKRSNVVITIIIIFSCVFGYLSSIVETPELVLFRSSKGVFSSDYFMTAAKFFVFLASVFSFPTMYISFRSSFFQLFYSRMTYSNKE